MTERLDANGEMREREREKGIKGWRGTRLGWMDGWMVYFCCLFFTSTCLSEELSKMKKEKRN